MTILQTYRTGFPQHQKYKCAKMIKIKDMTYLQSSNKRKFLTKNRQIALKRADKARF